MGNGQKITLILMSVIFLGQIYWTQGEDTYINHYTSTGQRCYDACRLHENEYYWCNTDKGWDYCSPSEDVTCKNEPCRADHQCDTHGLGYSWCRTESSWDYCGIINTSAPIYRDPRRQKRQPQDIVEICRKIDLGNRKMTIITAEKVNTLVFDNNWRNDIIDIISRYDNSYLRDQAGTIVKTPNFRIDIQGLIKKNNKNYYNLQIQVNIKRPTGKSTSVALVITPQSEDVPDRYVRRAFTESFTRGAKVSVDVKPYDNKPGKRGRNCN